MRNIICDNFHLIQSSTFLIFATFFFEIILIIAKVRLSYSQPLHWNTILSVQSHSQSTLWPTCVSCTTALTMTRELRRKTFSHHKFDDFFEFFEIPRAAQCAEYERADDGQRGMVDRGWLRPGNVLISMPWSDHHELVRRTFWWSAQR